MNLIKSREISIIEMFNETINKKYVEQNDAIPICNLLIVSKSFFHQIFG